ncbi:hypothetical protein DERP_006909, partial [Dermatophagoides pteronyssinus]
MIILHGNYTLRQQKTSSGNVFNGDHGSPFGTIIAVKSGCKNANDCNCRHFCHLLSGDSHNDVILATNGRSVFLGPLLSNTQSPGRIVSPSLCLIAG